MPSPQPPPRAPTPRTRTRSRIGWILAAVGVVGGAVGCIASAVFVLADLAAGRAVAIAAVLALLLVPFVIGMLIERLTEKRAKVVHAERVYAWLLPLTCLVVLAVSLTALRPRMGEALAQAPRRYGWDGLFGRAVLRVGLALAPSARPPSTTPTARGTLTVSSETDDAPGVTVTIVGSTTHRTRATGSPAASSSTRVGREADAPGDAPAEPLPAADRYRAGDPAYSEPGADCATLPDLSAARAAHVPGGLRATAEAIARVRYPDGLPFVKAQDDAMLGAWFKGATDSLDGIGERFEVAVHEGSHVWGSKRFSPAAVSYAVRSDLTIVTARLSSFARGEILAEHPDAASDTYAKIYLEGSSGAQGFDTLLDEYNAYAHSLASRYCTRDLVPASSRVSARDGILTFMFYVETYLHLARTKHPADYAAILADPGHRRLILTVWDRAELWLRRSASERSLGIHDERARGWAYAPERLAELGRVRDADKAKPAPTAATRPAATGSAGSPAGR